MRIGQVEFPAVNRFDIDSYSKSIQHIPGLGMRGYVPAEYQSALPSVSFGGYILKTFSNTRTLADRVGDINALASRRSCYNFCYNVRGQSGYLAIDAVKPIPNNGTLWPFTGSGSWYDASQYSLRYCSQPVQMVCPDPVQLGHNWVSVPVGATYAGGDGYDRTVSTEDGDVTQVRSDTVNVNFDPVGLDCNNGECKCYDGTTQVYTTNHLCIGNLVISSSTYRVHIFANSIQLDYWNGTGWTEIDTLNCGNFSRWWTIENTPDRIKAVTNSGLYVEVERGKIPHIYSPNVITTSFVDIDDETTESGGYLINHLSLDTDVWICSNTAFVIASGIVQAGHYWIYHDSDDGEILAARDCLMISNMQRQVVER